MKKKKLLKYICLFLSVITVISGVSFETPVPVFAEDNGGTIWDEEFTGIGDEDITYRSYMDFYIYDDETRDFLGIIKMDKKNAASSIDGTYVVRYNGKDLITFRNDGNYCNLAMGDRNSFEVDFFQFLFNNSNSSIRGHEHYRVVGHSTIKAYAGGNQVGPYNPSRGSMRCAAFTKKRSENEGAALQ